MPETMNDITKIGLVLEGGAMRGLFTAGVMDVMMENGIDYDGIIGVSAGSSFGCNYKSQQPGRVLRYNLKYASDPRYMGLRSLISSGNLVGAEFAYHKLPLQLDIFDIQTFEQNPTEFYLVATDVATGEPAYYRMDKVNYESLEWLRASASMPGVTKPVKVDDGRLMLDGGISDSIPLDYFRSIGYNRNVVVLTQPRNYVKKASSKWLWRMLMHSHKAIAEAMCRRHEMYNAQLRLVDEGVRRGDTFVIAPDAPLPIGRVSTDKEKMRNVYSIGRQTAERLLPRLVDFIAG